MSSAKSFFEKYISLSHTYDGSLVDLYSDTALIKRYLTYSDGKTSVLIIPAKKYKQKLMFYAYLARITRYRNEYLNLKYSKESNNVRITGFRQVASDHYISPFSFLIGKDNTGKMIILEDITNTKAVNLCNRSG